MDESHDGNKEYRSPQVLVLTIDEQTQFKELLSRTFKSEILNFALRTLVVHVHNSIQHCCAEIRPAFLHDTFHRFDPSSPTSRFFSPSYRLIAVARIPALCPFF